MYTECGKSRRALGPGWPRALVDAGLVASAGPCSPEKGLDLCLACARPSARGGSQTELELADTSFQNWGNVVLNIYFLKDTHTKKRISQAVKVSLHSYSWCVGE